MHSYEATVVLGTKTSFIHSFKMAMKHLTVAKLIEFIYLWKKLKLTLYSKNDPLAD
jgi:hypothetical protein